jgi:hypothetical protein
VYCSKHGEISSLNVFKGIFQILVQFRSFTGPCTEGELDEPKFKFESSWVDCRIKGIFISGVLPLRIFAGPVTAGSLK